MQTKHTAVPALEKKGEGGGCFLEHYKATRFHTSPDSCPQRGGGLRPEVGQLAGNLYCTTKYQKIVTLRDNGGHYKEVNMCRLAFFFFFFSHTAAQKLPDCMLHAI